MMKYNIIVTAPNLQLQHKKFKKVIQFIEIFNELDEKWNENGYDEEYDIDINTEFDILFNDTDRKNKYIVIGTFGLWTGKVTGHSPRTYDSIKEAIIDAEDGFGICYTQVYEEAYGKLCFKTIHHDGTNYQEIRQLTKYGEELCFDKDYSIEHILKLKGTTKNVKYTTRGG